MAYRRKQVTPKATTFVEDFRSPPPATATATAGPVAGDDAGGAGGGDSSSSLAAQAIRASAAHRDSSSLSSAYGDPAYGDPAFSSSVPAAGGGRPNRLRRSATYTARKDATAYEYTSMKSLNESKYGFWGVLARKAKSILDDDNPSQQYEDHGRSQLQMPDTQTGEQFSQFEAPDHCRKTENLTFNKSSESIASSLHQIGGTIKKSLEEGLTKMESRTADIIQETRKLQIRRKTGGSNALNAAADLSASNSLSQDQNDHDTQLKASRDVANAMAAKAKLLLRELKTVKADLAFAKERCTQLEDENRRLRESREKGDNHEDEDLIRLQLETLLEEKGRLAHENSVYARENRFLREIVEYHQLTMQDVIYVDDGIDEVSEVCPIKIPPKSRSVPEPLSPIVSAPSSPTQLDNTSPRSLNDEGAPEAPSTLPSEGVKDNVVSETKPASPPPSPKPEGLRKQHSPNAPA
ncbi:uncharacterized protein M6B38_305170 [Iris pallida]|uniref:Uncharacterized protein n=1 Tax=Iris pallida TaxID=29817 RepID=A0AAX6GTR7_IRIPA|nr:uncharacterized protein M6B38_347670 [Iris pallida]KAJ6841756.1 uncharacterized protein M6B38_305170 [Iris pallida]